MPRHRGRGDDAAGIDFEKVIDHNDIRDEGTFGYAMLTSRSGAAVSRLDIDAVVP